MGKRQIIRPVTDMKNRGQSFGEPEPARALRSDDGLTVHLFCLYCVNQGLFLSLAKDLPNLAWGLSHLAAITDRFWRRTLARR